MPGSRTVIVGISGVSSSGKTTLSRLLRDIFPQTSILHEDDFYKPDDQIPQKSGVADWDCLEAIDVPALHQALLYISRFGTTPPNLISKEDQNSVGSVPVADNVIQSLQNAQRHLDVQFPNRPKFVIIDGFLLFSEEMKAVRELFDIKLLLRVDYKTAKARREARSGYVTLDGFWEDPPGYVDNVVWPNYVKDHAFLFQGGDVEGEPNEEVLERLSIKIIPYTYQADMSACLKWAVAHLNDALGQSKELAV